MSTTYTATECCTPSVFRSSWPHGRIRSIDVAAAAAVPGVIGVFTHADFSAVLKPIRSRIAAMPGFEHFLQLPLATDKVRYVGEPMAVVVATSSLRRGGRRSLISAEIEDLPPVLSWEQAGDRSVLIHDSAGTNNPASEVGRGDAEAAFKTAPLRAARALHRAPAHRRSHGDARAGRGVGRRRDAHDRIRHHQGAVLQPQHARLHARSSRKRPSS